jgi:thiamine-phosphate pyrophosphorylase
LVNKINFLYRILDANINRALEGLRVCEDTTRFVLNDYYLSRKLKNLRHRLNKIIKKMDVDKKILLKARDTEKDIGKKSNSDELQRKDFRDVLFANLQRIKESLRVLEEFSKIIDKRIAQEYKNLRYEIYKIEKKIALSI